MSSGGNIASDVKASNAEIKNNGANLSGYELEYDPDPWNHKSFVKKNNCYSYVMNDRRKWPEIPQPGDRYNKNKSPKNTYDNCDDMIKRMQFDYPRIYQTDFNTPCKKGFYKSYLTLDPQKDYHFYRQDSNGTFSHKPGKNPVSNKDAAGNIILNPETASHAYKSYTYSKPCGFLCIPRVF